MNKWFWVLLIIILIGAASAAFLFMDLQAVNSNTATDSQVSSFRIGLEQGEPPAPFATDEDVSFRHRIPVHFDDGDSPSLKIN
jgi:hypothetical protein